MENSLDVPTLIGSNNFTLRSMTVLQNVSLKRFIDFRRMILRYIVFKFIFQLSFLYFKQEFYEIIVLRNYKKYMYVQ